MIVGGLITTGVSYYLARVFARHHRTMEAQGRLIAEQNESLQNQMIELETQAQEMEEQRNQLERANEQLERRTRQAEQAETVAREASEAKSRFLATMSHELRTPLNAILGYTELLDSGVADQHANTDRSFVKRARTAGKHLLSLIDDVLAITKSEAHKDKPQLEAVRVGDLLNDVVSVIAPLAEQKQLAFEVKCDVDGQRVMIDRRRVRQILINVLGNAVKFTKEGSVQLFVDCADGKMIFKVRDTGPGISDEHAEKIFEPFWQAPYAHRGDRAAGVGLGLSVSRQLARAMGGELTVASPNGGTGSTFTLTLPFVEAA